MRTTGFQSLLVTGGMLLLALNAHAQIAPKPDPNPNPIPQPTLIQETGSLLLDTDSQDRISTEIVVSALSPGLMIRRFTITRANNTSFTIQFQILQDQYASSHPLTLRSAFYYPGKLLLDHYRMNPSGKKLQLEFAKLYRYSNQTNFYHMGGTSTVALKVKDPRANTITSGMGGTLKQILLYGNSAGTVGGQTIFGTLTLKRYADERLGHILSRTFVGQPYLAMEPYLVGELVNRALMHTTMVVGVYDSAGTWFIHNDSTWR